MDIYLNLQLFLPVLEELGGGGNRAESPNLIMT
jgi:hypothetical protein